jgi:hypothetical protein
MHAAVSGPQRTGLLSPNNGLSPYFHGSLGGSSSFAAAADTAEAAAAALSGAMQQPQQKWPAHGQGLMLQPKQG